MTEKFSIEERENGPIVVKGARSMVGPDGAAIEVKDVMALCRCGGSGNKPFCDGSHRTNGFESRGGTPSGKDRLYSFVGADVTVQYNPRICSHAAECIRIAPSAFDPQRKPWINPDEGEAQAVEAVVRSCPSGALQFAGTGHLTPDRADITVQENGPYWVLGAELEAGLPGEGGTAEKLVLCRCGQSGNKPFCDGSHRDAGWKG